MFGVGPGYLGVRRQLLSWLDDIGALDVVLRRRAGTAADWLPVLAYHRVAEPTRGYPYDRGVIDCTPRSFDRQLATLKQYFSVIGLDQLLAWFDHREPLPPNPVMITFDDGYRDNYEQALPILQHHGLKAVFFISSGYVTDRRMFWWDRISYMFHHSEVGRACVGYPSDLVLDLREDAAGARRTVLKIIKNHYALDLDRFLDELSAGLEIAWDPRLERALVDDLLMTWDEVRALSRAGMDIGSHTRTHRVLWTLDQATLKSELEDSRRDIEGEIGREVKAISYPVGVSLRRLPSVTRAIADAGYSAGFTMDSRANHLSADLDRFDLRRVSMDIDLEHPQFRARLAMPQLP
jgi:peptidoglycan/xylan/chitin deacetylase (PgdA/CDA1 family)